MITRAHFPRPGCIETQPKKESTMFLKQKKEGHLVEVLGLNDLVNPIHKSIVGRLHYGEELQDADKFAKTNLMFPSGEELPKCWLDVHYRDAELRK
jgi:hypothetical protein